MLAGAVEAVRARWRWLRRPRSQEERAEAELRRLYLLKGGAVAVWTICIVGKLVEREYLAAVAYALTSVIIWGPEHYRHTARVLARENSLLKLVIADVIATHLDGVAPVLHTDGRCVVCEQGASERAPAFRCVSGHLSHIACLVTGPDHPPRCSVCLRLRPR